ncbi:hypothetical protein AAFF_G00075900 [Aldrovandia affinis]|uniref:Uncharacterized protein n=1 Tax=Aldrovandia affinis TaxID=143900 RepID=A0AAD7RYD0_9TELE|nr:hypothetical protein AAFF_G00075900 [Aldrovandia affinis]
MQMVAGPRTQRAAQGEAGSDVKLSQRCCLTRRSERATVSVTGRGNARNAPRITRGPGWVCVLAVRRRAQAPESSTGSPNKAPATPPKSANVGQPELVLWRARTGVTTRETRHD